MYRYQGFQLTDHGCQKVDRGKKREDQEVNLPFRSSFALAFFCRDFGPKGLRSFNLNNLLVL